MHWEDPDQLLLMKLGREEYCQRMLTSLIIGGPYPKWNSKNIPSESGFKFLKILNNLAFDSDIKNPIEFIDEFDLPGKSINERGGAPDYAVIWDNHLWMIELKTESSSHRNDQLPLYLELANHHYSPPHKTHFRCRKCYDLMYQSQESNVYDGIRKKLAKANGMTPIKYDRMVFR